jgi:hypothetical protein
MRRTTVLSIAAAAVGTALVVPGAAHAAVSKADQHAARIVVRVTDPKGDVVAKTGSENDLTDGSGLNPFKPGHGTATPPSAADRAMDLTAVTYTIVRTGTKPALKINYKVRGPFTRHEKVSSASGSIQASASADGVITALAKGFTVTTDNFDKHPKTELDDKAGTKQSCPGLVATMTAGTRVATQTIPLSCLTAARITTSALRSESVHLTVVADGTTSADESVTVATDKAAKTRVLPLTPYAK